MNKRKSAKKNPEVEVDFPSWWATVPGYGIDVNLSLVSSDEIDGNQGTCFWCDWAVKMRLDENLRGVELLTCIVHETYHAVHRLEEHVKQKMDEEDMAYTQDWLFTWICKCLEISFVEDESNH